MGLVRALRGVNLSVERGEIVGIAGETGCGKTTLSMSILRLLPQDAIIEKGKILFDGENLLELSYEEMQKVRQARISLILQGTSKSLNPAMLTGLQVSETIEFHKKEPFYKAIRKTQEIFSEIGLGTNVILSLPDQLSVGTAQRVKIALAISTEPELIIADEPFVGLDSTLQAMVADLLLRLHDKYGFTALISSHEISRLFEITDKMAIMYSGKIIEYNETGKIYRAPMHPYTKGLVGAIPTIRSIEKRRRLIEIPGEPPSALNPPKGCPFWPRCPFAKEKCKTEEPELLDIDGGFVACHYAEELKDVDPWDFWGEGDS